MPWQQHYAATINWTSLVIWCLDQLLPWPQQYAATINFQTTSDMELRSCKFGKGHQGDSSYCAVTVSSYSGVYCTVLVFVIA